MINIDKFRKLGPAIVRWGMSLVFLYFGFSQIRNPESFIFWLPEWTANLFISQTIFVYINGIFEIVFGTLLLLGLFTRISGLLLGLHLAAITISIGFTQIGVRDFGLTITTFAVFFNGEDDYCLSRKIKRFK